MADPSNDNAPSVCPHGRWHEVECADCTAVERLEAKVDEQRQALIVARDFIKHHPAVKGEWPLVIDVIEGAIDA